jgi:hypothetical protein
MSTIIDEFSTPSHKNIRSLLSGPSAPSYYPSIPPQSYCDTIAEQLSDIHKDCPKAFSASGTGGAPAMFIAPEVNTTLVDPLEPGSIGYSKLGEEEVTVVPKNSPSNSSQELLDKDTNATYALWKSSMHPDSFDINPIGARQIGNPACDMLSHEDFQSAGDGYTEYASLVKETLTKPTEKEEAPLYTSTTATTSMSTSTPISALEPTKTASADKNNSEKQPAWAAALSFRLTNVEARLAELLNIK